MQEQNKKYSDTLKIKRLLQEEKKERLMYYKKIRKEVFKYFIIDWFLLILGIIAINGLVYFYFYYIYPSAQESSEVIVHYKQVEKVVVNADLGEVSDHIILTAYYTNPWLYLKDYLLIGSIAWGVIALINNFIKMGKLYKFINTLNKTNINPSIKNDPLHVEPPKKELFTEEDDA